MSSSRREFVAGVACALALPVLDSLATSAATVQPAAADPKPGADGWLPTVAPADLADGALEGKYRKYIILARTGTKIIALDIRCTHKGCAVRPKGGIIECPCHHAQYDAQGKPIKGPAKLELARHALRLNQDGIIEVKINATVTAEDAAGVLEIAPAATNP
ncbi:MAG: Rieske (2Fe-2S) protein [Phycisphaerae bacterium]